MFVPVKPCSEPYRRKMNKGKLDREHRVIWEQVRGRISPGLVVHHKNEDRRDNRIQNLELLTKAEHARLHIKLRDSKGRFVN